MEVLLELLLTLVGTVVEAVVHAVFIEHARFWLWVAGIFASAALLWWLLSLAS
ncbi:MAG: hypothetical protein H6737_24290 [Alphaproteobacteria bacterium]|nr:hypothetical protein [Alphaproteobacteria bacterium]